VDCRQPSQGVARVELPVAEAGDYAVTIAGQGGAFSYALEAEAGA
jgi:hypothetical protein